MNGYEHLIEIRLAQLYAKVAGEFPGKRHQKAGPSADLR
jgi:hypothetical protein